MQKATVNLLPRLSHRLLPRPSPAPRINPYQNLHQVQPRRWYEVPPRAWDSHVHDINPSHPTIPNAAYKPHTPTPSYYGGASWMEPFNPVYVQPSIYGTDNTCQLNALESKLEYKGADNARAVVAFDPLDTDRETLDEWHELGVRGVRINPKSGGARPSPAELKSLLGWYAEVIRPQETWALNLHVELDMAAQLEVLVPKLGVKVVLDHFGGLGSGGERLKAVRSGRAWQGLLRLMQNEDVYVKISAPYRITSNWEELEPFFRDLANVRQGRGIVFASDWPHTRFEDVDAERWIKMCLDWCGEDKKLKQNLFRYNAERLWDVEPGES
ncbi:hypothetical protein H2201_004303 [Coniosporium apollinis]|uniref:Amidohydrolase-related domain-containing protein n=1 Tax=Coniosporium apollinis TaxID=61459 RepID=A0ABQ9NTB3_9PEZI|nr:hypothetical protein H2201_004303 [Coniosporium apollinis]